MITVSPWLMFLYFLTGATSLNLGPDCQQLVHNFDGVVRPWRLVCLIFVPSGKYVHINVTKKSSGSLHAGGLVCESESTKDVVYDVEYVDSEFHLSYLATNEKCPLGNFGIMRMVFRSDWESVEFSVKVIENYENERNETSNGLAKITGKQDKDKMKTTIEMIPQLNISDNTTEVWEQNNNEMNTTIAILPNFTISDNTTEVWEQNNKEMKTTVAMVSEVNTSEHTTELTILIVTGFGVVFLLLTVSLCVYKIVDYKFESRLPADEIQLEQLPHNQTSQGTELSVLNKNDPDHSANLEPSDHTEDSNTKLGFHSP